MNCADCHLKADALVKNANDIAIRTVFAPQLADQFAIGFRVWSEEVSAGSNLAGNEAMDP
jgi:hypothetical protein